jgi:Cu+-exporting ATPase
LIEFFNSKQIETVLLSGDSLQKCESLAKEIGIKTVYAKQSPAEKIQMIAQFTAEENTSMFGDGINDAPALSRAFIGISLASASQIAIQSSDVILLNKNNLNQLNKALKISRYTLRTIKQNLFWAFSYNLIAIPIACLGYLNPMWAALFMAFSDVVVIGNSIRLKFKKIF